MYVVAKAGLEFRASWTAQTLSAVSSLKKAAAASFPGRVPPTLLEMRLFNAGLTSSAGKTLKVAVMGAARTGLSPGSVLALVTKKDGSALPALLTTVAGQEQGIVTFQVPPLPRRAGIDLRLALAAGDEQVGSGSVWICVHEAYSDIPVSTATGTCQCLGPTFLDGVHGKKVNAGPQVFAASGVDQQPASILCTAAVTTTSAKLSKPIARAVPKVEPMPPPPQLPSVTVPVPTGPPVPTQTLAPAAVAALQNKDAIQEEHGASGTANGKSSVDKPASGGHGWLVLTIFSLTAVALLVCLMGQRVCLRRARGSTQGSAADEIERVPALRVPGGSELEDADDDALELGSPSFDKRQAGSKAGKRRDTDDADFSL
eukprot:gnl/TRDRNA2_/TRDRNA2_166300_c0_seq1.p1 gnl/TRDRNA2_/TRDRNA2_166300_c0~~gnl/TRDRNA2_/TRDRNA2_166300_c0_seq1.p1  ORF type:complete len:380 (+),score=64.61 gnl/TRDRNA2_/TRDRNA2_166300_c0_seq1:26-1141(+)